MAENKLDNDHHNITVYAARGPFLSEDDIAVGVLYPPLTSFLTLLYLHIHIHHKNNIHV